MTSVVLMSKLEVRNDSQGQGHFGASRGGGSRPHNGIDFACAVGSNILAPVEGLVTKLGYCYNSDLSYRYVELLDFRCPVNFGPREDYQPSNHACSSCGLDHLKHRFFYLEPLVVVDDNVKMHQIMGRVQNIGRRYPGMTPHVHYEIKQADVFIDPAAGWIGAPMP